MTGVRELVYGVHMNPIACSHKFCGQPVNPAFATYKYVQGVGMLPFHTDCSYAHPEYDVSKGCGSPFTTITVASV